MSLDANTPLATFIDAVAAKQPTPGGGAVAAVVGALAAAIGEMAIRYSIGRKSTPHFDADLADVLSELTRARSMMLELVIEDQNAFAILTEAKKMPAEEVARAQAVSQAIDLCINVPRAIGATALTLLRVIEPVGTKCNPWLVSDLCVCVELAMATVRAAQYSVHANLNDVDEVRRQRLTAECDEQVRRGVALVKRALDAMNAKR